MTGRRVLVLGGSRSGKSPFAESLLAGTEQVVYVASAATRTDDEEWADRVRRHRERRPASWRTVETADIAEQLSAPGPAVLVDSATAWLARAMDDCGYWADELSDVARKALTEQVDRLCDTWQATARTAVLVSDEVGSGIVPAKVSGRRFRDELGLLNQRLAAAADEVYLVTAGIAQRLR